MCTITNTHIICKPLQWFPCKVKVKVKSCSIGALRHWCPQAYCILTPDCVHSFISRGATWAPSASKWANYILRYLASKSAIFGRTRLFYMPQSWDMGQIILLPLRKKAFFQPKKSDGFGRSEPVILDTRRQHANP
jgi:hypothetical protein